MSEAEEDFTKLSIEDRISHKSWKARQSGYEQVLSSLQNGTKAPFDFDLQLILKSAVTDSNQIAQEMGYGALVEYLTRFDDAIYANSLAAFVVEKGLSSTRTGIRSKALLSLLLFVEISGPESVTESLLAVLDHKTPKVVSGAVSAITSICSSFGMKDLPLKKITKVLPKLFDHKDKTVRAEASSLTVELYRWIGVALMSSLNELKPVQLKELGALFVEGERPASSRYRRGQKPATSAPLSSDMPSLSPAEEPIEILESAPVIEAFDLADPVAFIDKLPKSFYTDLSSQKWKERKEACETLLKLVSFPKLQDGRYFELVNVLAKRLQDPNVVVVVLVANAIEKIASGLKNSFSQYRNIVAGPLIERMKEKKTTLLDALRGAFDATVASLSSFTEIMEEIFSAMGHSNPNIRNEAILIISRFLGTPKSSRLGRSEIKVTCEKLLKAVEDSVPEIRDSASFSVASMMKVFGEKTISPFLERLDKVKVAKITDHLKTLEGAGLVNDTAPTLSSASSQTLIKTSSSISVTGEKQTSSKPAVSKKPVLKNKSLSKTNLGGPASKSSIVEEPIKYEFSAESSLEYIESIWTAAEIKMMSDSNWKNRLEAITSFKEKVTSSADLKTEAVIRFLLHTIGWKDNNFQVMVGMISVFNVVANPSRKFDRGCALLLTAGLVEKLGDLKIKKVVVSESFAPIKAMKAPKTIAESLLWISQSVRDFGVVGLKIKDIVLFVKDFLSNAAAAVRSNSIAVLVSIRQFGHPEIRDYVSDIGSAILAQIDVEFTKCASAPAPAAPQKTQNIPLSVTLSASAVSHSVDLNSLISNELLEQLKNSNWKERKAGLESLMTIVSRQPALQANLNSEFIACLKSRLSDSNKNLASLTVDLLGKLAVSIGKPLEKYVRTFVPPMLSQLSDQKAAVRTVVLSNLDKLFDVVGISPLINCVVTALSTEQPQIRKDLLGWLTSEGKNIEYDANDANLMIPCILACLLDRAAEVRKAALAVLLRLSSKVDASAIRAKAADLYHGAQYSTLAPHLDSLGFKNVDSPIANTSSQAASLKADSFKTSKSNLKTIAKASSASKKEAAAPVVSDELSGELALISEDLKLKDHRSSMDRGVLKWNFEAPRKELIDLLADQCAGNLNGELISLLFSTDHYKEKDFLNGLQQLDSFLSSSEIAKATVIQRAICNCDLVLRYLSIRFCDTNTSIFIKSLDLLETLISTLDEGGYLLNEFEASSFIPYFINKLGDPKESMRVKLRLILKKLGRVYPVSKLLQYLLKGLDSKNSKTRAECLDEIASLIQRHGQSSFVASKVVPTIALQVSDRDASCRNAALNAICQIHEVLGDDMQKYLSKITEKERDMISERLRRMPGKATLPKKLSQPFSAKKITSRTSTPNFFDENLLDKGAAATAENVPMEFSLDLDKLGLLPSVSSSLSTIATAGAINKLQGETFVALSSAGFHNVVDERLHARVELLISELTGFNVDQALEACRQLEKLILAHPNHDIIRSFDLVRATGPVLHSVFTKLAGPDTVAPRLCKHLLSLLVQIFSSKDSASLVPYSSLEACVKDVVYRLVDPTMTSIDPTKSLSRALNMLMVRIIDNCEPNATFRALLLILKEGVLDQAVSEAARDIQKKFIELVMKCLWKITKVIPSFLQNGTLHVDLLLLETNSFLSAAPPSYWKQKTVETGVLTADMPLRTVKTILHELVNVLGDNVTQFLSVLPDQSHTNNYIKQMLQSVKRKGGQGVTPKAIVKLEQHDFPAQLDAIFSQIADKEETKMGIERLNAIQHKFPSVMPLVEERLAKTGSYFQGYIRRGLAALVDQKNGNPTLSAAANKPADLPVRQSPVKVSPTDYDETLQKLQHLFNHPNEDAKSKAPSTYQSPVKAATEREVKAPGSVSREGRSLAVQELKERLARMKMNLSSNQI